MKFPKPDPRPRTKAQFETDCIECGFKIIPGDEIVKDDDGYWVHEDCAHEPS